MNRKLKVAMISPQGYSGICYYHLSLCKALYELGIEITLFTSKKEIVHLHHSYAKYPFFEGTYGDKSRLFKGFRYVLAVIMITTHLFLHKIRIAHFQILDLPPVDVLLFAILKCMGVHIVYTPHDIVSFKYGKNFPSVMLYGLCDRIIIHNKESLDSLEKISHSYAHKAVIIRQGNQNDFIRGAISRDAAKKHLAMNPESRVILFFGNISPRKGIWTLYDGFIRHCDSGQNTLLIVGKPARNFNVADLEEAVRYHPRIILRNGFCPHDLIEYYFRSADVVALPYLELFDSAVLRFAFSCACPCIISDIDAFSSFARHSNNCLIAKRDDPDDLADKILTLLNDTNLAETIARNAKIYSDTEWDWGISGRKTKTVYEELL